MKFLFILLSVWLLAISAEAQRRQRFHLPTDSTKDPHPYESIQYDFSSDLNGKQHLLFTLLRSTDHRLKDYPSKLDSVRLIGSNSAITLSHPKADTTCIDGEVIVQKGYCKWTFIFELEDNQKVFLKHQLIYALFFFDWDRVRKVKLAAKQRDTFMKMIME